jgi:hypothetical protein
MENLPLERYKKEGYLEISDLTIFGQHRGKIVI